jgi:hypothetical protein
VKGQIFIGAFAVCVIISRGVREPEYDANFVFNLHQDSSITWALVIPSPTFQAIRKAIDAAPSQRGLPANEVLELVARGLVQHRLNARGCRLIGVSRGIDDSVEYDGQCAWTSALGGGQQT